MISSHRDDIMDDKGRNHGLLSAIPAPLHVVSVRRLLADSVAKSFCTGFKTILRAVNAGFMQTMWGAHRLTLNSLATSVVRVR